MENHYRFTDRILLESYLAYWKDLYRKSFFVMGTVFAVMAILCIADRKNAGTYAFGLLLPVLYTATMFLRRRRTIRSIASRFMKKYSGKAPEARYRLDWESGMILQRMDGEETSIPMSGIEKVLETENLIVIILNGRMYLALDKKGFLSGTADECIRLLREKARKKS